jgi:DNA-directed RNA polymerase specialized sigma24 family protein
MQGGLETAQAFLEYVARNDKRLKNNLRKNITYDPLIFEDVYQDTIIRVYDTIIKNNREIEDFEQYFFIASKWTYVAAQKKERKKQVQHTDLDQTAENIIDNATNKEACLKNINDVLKFTAMKVCEHFSPKEADVFIIYQKLKAESGVAISYEKMAKIMSTTPGYIRETIKKVKAFVNNDTEIKKYRELNIYPQSN